MRPDDLLEMVMSGKGSRAHRALDLACEIITAVDIDKYQRDTLQPRIDEFLKLYHELVGDDGK